MRETWKDIKGYEGLYQVSNLGNVKSVNHYASNGKCLILYKGKLLKPWFDGKKHYLQVTLSKDNVKKKYLIHRLVAETFINNTQNLPEVNHKNGCKTDNKVNNLEWVTSKENKAHAIKNGYYKNVYKNRKSNAKIFINGLSLKDMALKENITYFQAYNKYIRGLNG